MWLEKKLQFQIQELFEFFFFSKVKETTYNFFFLIVLFVKTEYL